MILFMEQEELKYGNIEEYQSFLKQRQELLGYCKKIAQGIENLDEKSGERAIWELVQNARDMDENCRIRIELLEDRLVFKHHGKPFDYLSLLALVNQNSSKDNPGADLVGQYGTGFMTTHAFNSIVVVDGPFMVMSDPRTIYGYVELGDFVLNRSFCCNGDNFEKAILEMKKEMQLVDEMYKKTPIYPELPDKWTSFTYVLDPSVLESVSKQIEGVIRFMPFVLTINSRIKEVEIIDKYSNQHYCIKKSDDKVVSNVYDDDSWTVVENDIYYNYFNNDNNDLKSTKVRSLQSKNRDDIVVLPPFPNECGSVTTIPSLFLWFPLLGTECFGVNFVFHSKRFYPVEKRNNILLPENVPSKLEKGKKNELVLKEMMGVLFDYYKKGDNDNDLTLEMCHINFHSNKDDEITTKFYSDLQELWKAQIPSWKIIPTIDGKKAMNEPRVRVLHPDFYKNLTSEQRAKYESTLATYVQCVHYNEEETFLLPISELIAWSETVSQWGCDQDSSFFITVKDICKSVQSKTDKLHEFLSFLVDSDNATLMDDYELLPNRKGDLKKKGDLRHGDFMTTELYSRTELLMGSDASRMIDTSYNDIGRVSSYKEEDLQRSINQTIGQWRKTSLGSNKETLPEAQLNALITFCLATSNSVISNYRRRMMKHIVKLFNKEFIVINQPKLTENEEDFYNPAFNFLLDYSLYTISTKDSNWVIANLETLKEFLTEYSSSSANERLARLDEYAVIPNYLYNLCTKKELSKNVNITEQLAQFYMEVIKKDLHEKWVHDDFKEIFTYAEQKASDVANEIQNKLSDEEFQDTIVLDIIELAENENTDNWKLLFRTIYAQRESIRYKLGTPEERKAINRMMKKKDPVLLEMMADVADRTNAKEIINNVNSVIAQMEHDAIIKMLGDYVETHIQKYLTEALLDIGVTVENQQCGQDFILTKDGYDDYYVEVKSRWESDQTVEMSSTQFERAVKIPDNYALIGVNMYHFDRERAKRNDPMELSEIYSDIKVLDNIGHLEADLKKRTDEAFKGNYTDIRLDGSYKVRVPQNVFNAYPLGFNGFVNKLKERFSKNN